MIIIKDPTVIMKCRMTSRTLFLYLILCLSEKVDSIQCSFTFAFFLTRHISQNIPLKHVLIIIVFVCNAIFVFYIDFTYFL
jgi:hypothetical protein